MPQPRKKTGSNRMTELKRKLAQAWLREDKWEKLRVFAFQHRMTIPQAVRCLIELATAGGETGKKIAEAIPFVRGRV